MTTLFISDLHLDSASPEIAQQFVSFLDGEARSAEALYILGDLFESWVGDDAADAEQTAASARCEMECCDPRAHSRAPARAKRKTE